MKKVLLLTVFISSFAFARFGDIVKPTVSDREYRNFFIAARAVKNVPNSKLNGYERYIKKSYQSYKQLTYMPKHKLKTLLTMYKLGKLDNVGLILSGIAMKESILGHNRYNFTDFKNSFCPGSYGVLHVSALYTIYNRIPKYKVKRMSRYNKAHLCSLTINYLLKNENNNAQEAIRTLKNAYGRILKDPYWKKVTKKRMPFYIKQRLMFKVLSAYNTGNYKKIGKTGYNYAFNVKCNIKAIRIFFRKHDILNPYSKFRRRLETAEDVTFLQYVNNYNLTH